MLLYSLFLYYIMSDMSQRKTLSFPLVLKAEIKDYNQSFQRLMQRKEVGIKP